MTKYSLYRKLDETNQEPIDTGRFVDMEEAIKFFAQRKNLSIREFVILYKVVQR
jgi:hypothetical protein